MNFTKCGKDKKKTNNKPKKIKTQQLQIEYLPILCKVMFKEWGIPKINNLLLHHELMLISRMAHFKCENRHKVLV